MPLRDRQGLPGPAFDGCAQFFQPALKEVIPRFDPDQFLGIGESLNKSFKPPGRAELVARPADKEFWFVARTQKFEIIDPASISTVGRPSAISARTRSSS